LPVRSAEDSSGRTEAIASLRQCAAVGIRKWLSGGGSMPGMPALKATALTYLVDEFHADRHAT
jgi:hypothetical protein